MLWQRKGERLLGFSVYRRQVQRLPHELLLGLGPSSQVRFQQLTIVIAESVWDIPPSGNKLHGR